MKVQVPQDHGDIVLSGRADSTTYKVVDGKAEVPEADLSRFLLAVPGALAPAGAPAPTTNDAEPPQKEQA